VSNALEKSKEMTMTKSIQTPSLEILTLSSTFTVLGRPTRVCGGQGVSKISDVKL